MSLSERLREERGERSVGPGEPPRDLRRRVDDDVSKLASDLGLAHHDESLQIEAAEANWRSRVRQMPPDGVGD